MSSKAKSNPKLNPSRKFIFTLHNWTEIDWNYLPVLFESRDEIVYLKAAQETGSEGESPHLQGCILFKSTFKTQRPAAVSKILMGPNKSLARLAETPEDSQAHQVDKDNPGKFLKHHCHVESILPTSSAEEAAAYCGNPAKEANCVILELGEIAKSRQGTRTDFEDAQKIFKAMTEARKKLSEIEDALPKFWANSEKWVRRKYKQYRPLKPNFFDTNDLFEWQRELVDYGNSPPNARKIIFIVDLEGNVGKSKLVDNARHLWPDKTVFDISPKSESTMAYLFPDDDIDIFMMDCPRQTQYNISYTFLEECLNGKIVNEKYECSKKEFNPPHVFVFMNRHPKFGASIMSADRYVIVEVGLTLEERASLGETQKEGLHPYVKKHLPRTEEIRQDAERTKAEKRSHVQIDGHTYHDNGIFFDGRKKKKDR